MIKLKKALSYMALEAAPPSEYCDMNRTTMKNYFIYVFLKKGF